MLKDDKGHIIKKDTVVTENIFLDIYGKYPEKYCNVRLNNCIKTWMCRCDGDYTAWELANVSRIEFLKIRNLGAKTYPYFVRFQTWLKNELEDAENVSSSQCNCFIVDIEQLKEKIDNLRLNSYFRGLICSCIKILVRKECVNSEADSMFENIEDYFHDVGVMESIIKQISEECQIEQK